MYDVKSVIKNRLMFFISSVIVCILIIITYLNKSFLPKFIKYGEYQSNNILLVVLNAAIEEQMNKNLKEKAIIQRVDDVLKIDFNVEILNSIAYNVINRSYQILYNLENGIVDEKVFGKINGYENNDFMYKGLTYEIPLSMVLGNSLIGNLGGKIPLRYQFVGEFKWQIISDIKEYGINNALIEISLQVSANSRVLVPMMTEEKKVDLNVPIVAEIIQGKVPDYYLGTQVIGGGKS